MFFLLVIGNICSLSAAAVPCYSHEKTGIIPSKFRTCLRTHEARLPGYFHDTPGIGASKFRTGFCAQETRLPSCPSGCALIRQPAFPAPGSNFFGFAVGERWLLALNSDQLRHSPILFCMLQLAFRFSAIRWARAAFRSGGASVKLGLMYRSMGMTPFSEPCGRTSL